jgi:hypothetical protein
VTFIEAAATGKKVRPKGSQVWWSWKQAIDFCNTSSLTDQEWETEPETVTVTRDQLADWILWREANPSGDYYIGDDGWNKLKELSK